MSGFSRVYPRRDGDGVDWLTCLTASEYDTMIRAAKRGGIDSTDPLLIDHILAII